MTTTAIDISRCKHLSTLCSKLVEPDSEIDGRIFKLLKERPGQVWERDAFDDVWHLRDEEDPFAFEGPPCYTADLETALAARGCTMRLANLQELPASVSKAVEGKVHAVIAWTDGVSHKEKISKGYGESFALAVIAAILIAYHEGAAH